MKISFHGAAGEVTGSCNLLETKNSKILVDCGMFQGDDDNEQKNYDRFGFDPAQLDSVIVTHAHLDHVGRLPLIVQGGYSGKIFLTPATAKLAELILEDAVKVMQYEYRKKGKPIIYDETAVTETLTRFELVDYNIKKVLEKEENGSFVYHDAGHIFGSAFVELNVEGKKVVFSGDLGNTDVPILRDTEVIPNNTDLVICESTYGGRIHEAKDNAMREKLVEKMIGTAIKKGGVLMIPSFALERTQELLYTLNDLIDRKKTIPRIPIFLDSPLAIKATEVFRMYPEYYNERAKKLHLNDDDLFEFPGLTVCESKEESKKINDTTGSKMIIAGAGMMNGGRIIHHAKRYMSDSSNTLLFIGYQAYGTLGRKILEGTSQVEILGDRIPVKCHIDAIGALSAHADQIKILDWLGGAKNLPKKVLFNHGEEDQAEIVANRVRTELGFDAEVVELNKEYIV